MAFPLAVMITVSGLSPPWMNPAAWASATASAIWMRHLHGAAHVHRTAAHLGVEGLALEVLEREIDSALVLPGFDTGS